MKRREAKQLGLKTYNTGKPCKHGHTSDRYTSTAICIECVTNETRRRRKEDPQSFHLAWRKWLENNRAVHSQRTIRWQKANKERVRQTQKEWVRNNPDKAKAKTKRWRENNPLAYAKIAARSARRRAARVPDWLTQEDNWLISEIYRLTKLRTKLTGVPWEVDHILPLRGSTVSGLHVPSNLQVILRSENRVKRNSFAFA